MLDPLKPTWAYAIEVTQDGDQHFRKTSPVIKRGRALSHVISAQSLGEQGGWGLNLFSSDGNNCAYIPKAQ